MAFDYVQAYVLLKTQLTAVQTQLDTATNQLQPRLTALSNLQDHATSLKRILNEMEANISEVQAFLAAQNPPPPTV